MLKLDNEIRNRWLIVSAVMIIVMFIVSAWAATRPELGDEICTHWNAAGECDDWGSKFVGLYLLPLVAVGVVGLFVAIPYIEPRQRNLALSRTAYVALWIVLLFYFLILHIVLVVNVLFEAGVIGFNLDLGRLIPVTIGGLFIVIGNYMGKIRSNFLMGIRTPWTLSSELSWNKTHRLGGKLFVASGLLLIFSSLLLPATWWLYVMLGTLLPMVIFLFAYSYVVWRNDPEAHNDMASGA